MKRIQRFFRLTLSLAAVTLSVTTGLTACASGPMDGATVELTVIETSDLHGAWLPYDFKTGKTKDTSLANVATIVSQERAKGEILLLDGGDNLQGQPIVYYYNFVNTAQPHPFASMVNDLGYDAIAVGNHDIETGHAVYDAVNKSLNTKFISANLVNKSDEKPYFKPYTVVTKKGLKIAILGLTEPAFVKNFPEVLYSGIKVEDMVESAKKWVPIIQRTEKPDIIIGLFHAGVDYSYGRQTADTPYNENAAQLIAERVPGLDLILVGHDHQGWDGKGYDPATKNKIDVRGPDGNIVPIYGAVDEAKKIPVMTLQATYTKTSGDWSVSVTGSLVDTKTVQPDAAFVKKYDAVAEEAKAWLSKPIGKMAGKINTRDSMFGDSAFVDLIHDLQLSLTRDPELNLKPADISFCAPLSSDAWLPSRADGVITVADMFTLYKYENWLYTMSLTGAQVKGFLEDSCNGWFNQMKDASDHLIAFNVKADGSVEIDPRYNLPRTKVASYNYDSAQGIEYTVDVSKPTGQRVTIQSLADGTPFDENKTYTVAINSYRAMGGGGLLERGAGIPAADLIGMKYVTSATVRDLRIYLTQWFEKQGDAVIEPKADNNWTIIPADWVAAGAERDRALMYPSK